MLRSFLESLSSGVSARGRALTSAGLVALSSAVALGCGGNEETRTLQPVQVALSDQMAPISAGEDLEYYEVKRSVLLPVRAPSREAQRNLNQNPVSPYPSQPFVTFNDVEIQVTYVISNLDEQAHEIELLLDPHNEFGRYWPGLQLVDADEGEFLPNLSGYNELFVLPGTRDGKASRRHGTFTFQDMDELAIDFATAINIIENVPPPDPEDQGAANPTTLVNHLFHWQNRSYETPLTQRYIPQVIPGLTGFDIGLRSYAPANVAIEIVVEIKEIDEERDRVLAEDESTDLAYPEPTVYWTVGAM